MSEAFTLEMKSAAPRFSVLGVRIDAVQIRDVIFQIQEWIDAGEVGKFVAVTGMHGVSEARSNPRFKAILNSAGLAVPDGMPLVWLGRWHGHALRRRVYGPELMEIFCRETGPKYRHFFYGGAPGVADELARKLQGRFQIQVAGTLAPPFRPLTQEEDEELSRSVRGAAPDVVWVGLGTPKQEEWMYEHREHLRVPVMLGVGAAFDLSSGRLRRAPTWMRESGLEWLFRLSVEPRRLWRRYLVTIPSAIWSVSLELCNLKRFD